MDNDLDGLTGNLSAFFGDSQDPSWRVFKLQRDLSHHFLTSMLSFAVQYFLLPSGLVVTPNPKTTYSGKLDDQLAYAVHLDQRRQGELFEILRVTLGWAVSRDLDEIMQFQASVKAFFDNYYVSKEAKLPDPLEIIPARAVWDQFVQQSRPNFAVNQEAASMAYSFSKSELFNTHASHTPLSVKLKSSRRPVSADSTMA